MIEILSTSRDERGFYTFQIKRVTEGGSVLPPQVDIYTLKELDAEIESLTEKVNDPGLSPQSDSFKMALENMQARKDAALLIP